MTVQGAPCLKYDRPTVADIQYTLLCLLANFVQGGAIVLSCCTLYALLMVRSEFQQSHLVLTCPSAIMYLAQPKWALCDYKVLTTWLAGHV